MTVVCNTSPLILLAKIGRLDLLYRLYDQVVIPVPVLDEVGARSTAETTAIEALVENQTLVVEIEPGSAELLESIPADLGAGERAAIAVALETEADLVILDDRAGRRIALQKGLSVTGTIGILIEARARNMIPSVRGELDRLIEAGMWIDEAFYDRILQEFDE